MGRCLIGNSVSASPNRAVITRSGASAIMNEETRIQTDSGISGWHFGANRMHYLFLDQPWLLSGGASESKSYISGHSSGDAENNRLTVATHKLDTGDAWTWAQGAAATATVNASLYSNMQQRGSEIAAWQVAHAGVGKWGSTFLWSFHHEPGDDAPGQGGSVAAGAANWIACTQNIYNIWVSEGVQIWQGSSDWTTTQEGMILSVNLTAGAAAGARDSDITSFWGSASGSGAGNAWMDQHCLMYATDVYNVGPTPDSSQRMKAFGFLADTTGCKRWMDNKKIYQASQGRTFLSGIFETGCQSAASYPAAPHQSWIDTGLAATPENWLRNMRDYIRDDWPNLNILTYWDDTAPPPGHSWELDTTVGYWNAAVPVLTDATFNSSLTPLPSGVVATATELGMVTA
jgi:hypothetical protein